MKSIIHIFCTLANVLREERGPVFRFFRVGYNSVVLKKSACGNDSSGEVIGVKKEEILKRYVCTPCRVAVVGASPKADRPVFRVMNYLSGAGFTLFPVNPGYAGVEILGLPCVADLASLKEGVDVVALFLSEKMQGAVEEDLKQLSYKPVVWFQPGAQNEPLASLLTGAGYPVVEEDCLMAAHMNKCGV
ncbi:MAG TPA: CoA-binding protein [Synergistaceae bacterium]|jgi:predicted CoA-binding protein|nr:CoA-binding protein [Synergistaceae bacterium]